MTRGGGWHAVVLLLVCIAIRVRSDASDHKYKVGDPVPLYSNKVGPFHNPRSGSLREDWGRVGWSSIKKGGISETYRYFDLPFCSPGDVKDKSEALGEVLNGDRLVSAPYKLDFLVDKESEVICKKKLSKKEVGVFEVLSQRTTIFKCTMMTCLYGVSWERLTRKAKLIPASTTKWKETNVAFEKRMEKYSHSSSLPRHLEIHWFSIINSCVTVLLLTGFLATILMRVLKNDFVKYAHDEETADDQEETGWKYIHGDVFRFPKYKSLFAAALGSGTQLFTLEGCDKFQGLHLWCSFLAMIRLLIFVTVRNLLLTGGLFCGPLFLTFCFLNTVAIAYHATAALPFGTIVVIFLIWALVTSPLLVLGGIAGKNSKAEFQAPCRTTKYPREIPPLPWYRGTLPQMAMAGFLPFSAIYIELYYIFASVWGHRIYTIYSILFIVFIILLIVTAFITVALTYFQLAAEDHEWWWRSFLCGGSTGLFIYAYCLYYYYARSDMSGFMQTSFFFGYMACVCYAFFLMLGAVGFRAALFFVRHIYRSIKCE
ncbi:hypothetical protein DH2020_040347 [Rehmannia glutinosa]|uniref:Transmembrane 9 superfamily member n=1 Tax=Rehmannia glutinosa TaxID=99300 RepID=A0ABR0UVC6_REHGL